MQRTPEEYKAAYLHHKNAGNAEKAARVAQLYRQQLAGNNGSYQSPLPSPYANQAPPKDNAFQYGIDQAQKLYGGFVEGIGQKAGSDKMVQYGQDVQAQQDKDMAEGGYQFQYDSFGDAINKDGLSGFASHAGSSVAAGLPTTGATLVGGGLTAAAATAGAPAWLVASAGLATTATGMGLGVGENVLEQKEKTGKFDADVAIGVGVVSGLLDRLGVRKVFNLKDLENMTSQQIADTLRKKGMGQKAAQFLKGMGVEAVTETAQEGVNMAATAAQGGEYTPEEVQQRLTDAGITGGLMAGTIKTGTGTLGAATNLVSGTKSNKQSRQTDEDVQAQASLAKTLSNIAFVNKHDLTDLDKMSTNGARETVDKAHIQYTEDLKQLFADLKSRVAVTDQDSLEEVAQKVLAAAAYREGRNKTKSTVGVQEMSALESLAGDTREGQQALSVLRQLNQLTELHNSGYQGGVSAITDQFAPFGSEVGYDKGAVQAEKRIRGLLTVGGAVATGGSSLLGQVALQGTGRMIDKVTGRRSVVDNFVKQNQGQPGIPGSASPSLREASIAAEQAAAQEAAEQAEAARVRQEQSAADEREANLRRVQQGAPPLLGSPEDIFRDGTGLDRDGLAQVIRIIKRNENTPAAVLKAVEQYETSVATGGRVDYGLIRDINVLVDQYPQLKELQVRGRNTQAAAQGAQAQLSREDANYQRGIENNQAFNQELQNAVDDDGSIPPLNKAYLKSALADLARDLGAQPLDMVNSIIERAVEKGVTQEQMQSYLAPYLERVQQQQEAKNSRDQAAAEVDADPINENKTPVLQLDTSPTIIPVLDGTETPPKLSGKTEVARYLESRAKDRIGSVRDISNPEDRSAIADDMVAEAIYEMEQQDEGSAMDWYDSTIEKMLGMMALKYPEIETDINAKTPMLIALSIMSQNMDVPTNLKIAEKAYEYFRDNGKFEIFGQGKSSAVMELNFEKANILLEKIGSMAGLENFLKTKFTVKDLNPVLQEYLGDMGAVGGENVDTEVYGSAVFGPKVGNGFYTNLRGDFSPVTMDMWFMRTVGRLRGKVLAFDEAKFQGQLNRLKNALGRKRISRDALIDEAFKLIAKHEKDFKANRDLYDLPKGHPKRKVKSEATLAAYTIKGSLRDTVDAPASGTERNELRKLVQEAVEKFNAQTGLDIQPAAFQALIWYPEQDLYKSLGVKLKNVRKDFASSLKELLIKEGFDEADLNAAIDRVQQSREQRARSVRQSSVGDDARTAGRRSPEAGRPVQGQEDPVNPAIKPGTGILSSAVSDYFKQPTPAQIKEQVEPAEQIAKFVLGKPGSEFENGISTYDDLVDLANMLDVSVEIVSASKMQDKGSMGQMQAMLEGTAGQIKIQSVKKLGPLEFMKTLAHEVSHALEGLSLDRLRSESVYKYNAHPQARGSQDVIRQSSLRSRLNEVIELAFAKPGMFFQKKHDSTPSAEVSKKIVAEIDALQKGTMVGFADKPELGQQPMRETFPQFTRSTLEFNVPLPENASATQIAAREAEIAKMGSNGGVAEQIAKKFVDYHDYIKETAEFGVDPLHFYLMDPKGMKKMMPETFKFMRDIFNKSSMPIEMHANPMMTVIALLLAGFGKALSGEEEEERPQGVLNPQPALLTT